jgi:hypothetical protein
MTPEPLDHLLLAQNLFLPAPVLLLGLLPLDLLLLRVGRVVAGVGPGAAARQFHDLLHHLVEEVAVVADDQRGARVAPQVVLKPLARGPVDVVGGFVQQQQVRLQHQNLHEGQAGALPAGQHRHLLLPRRLGKPEAGQNVPRAVLALIAGEVLKAMVQFVVAMEGVLVVQVRRLQRGHLRPHRLQFGAGALRRLQDGAGVADQGLLREQRDPRVRLQRHAAGIRLLLAGDEAQEGGLAGPVRPHQAHLAARGDEERRALQYILIAEGLVDLRKRQQRHGTPGPRPAAPAGMLEARTGAVKRSRPNYPGPAVPRSRNRATDSATRAGRSIGAMWPQSGRISTRAFGSPAA